MPPLQKHTMNLRAGDFDFLASVCEPRGVQPSVLIRQVISKYVDKLKEQIGEQEQRIDQDIQL